MTRPADRLAMTVSNLERLERQEAGPTPRAQLEDAIRSYAREKLSRVPPYMCDDERELIVRRRELESDIREVAEVASAARLTRICEVAFATSGLLAASVQTADWRPATLRLHLDALALMIEATNPDACEQIAAPLRRLR